MVVQLVVEVVERGYEDYVPAVPQPPHWGKETVLYLQQAELLYPKLREFLTIRKRLDPHNVFLNEQHCLSCRSTIIHMQHNNYTILRKFIVGH